jgi:hypothetical protein
LSRKDFPSTYPCLVTWRVVDRLESLRRQDVVRAIEEASAAGASAGTSGSRSTRFNAITCT